MDYLRYVKQELKYSYEIVQEAIRKEGTENYLFPWKDVDDSKIVTKNFSKKLLSFELDQNSILQLLVGHTLYNDSSVVLRELIQNGLDAIKLQNVIEKGDKAKITKGKIIVTWNSAERILAFEDNGTGMTEDDIENYLLKVGTSKYNNSNFKEKYPDFVSISRFGIGILTCFLVANDIEIMTCASENNEANRIVFRNVDGKYLLKKLKKEELPNHIAKHGTIIKLHLREDANMQDIEFSIKRWIVFPHCEVILKKDKEPSIKIGYLSPKAALEDYISQGELGQVENIEVKEEEFDGITIAYALRHREYFQEDLLVTCNRRNYISHKETLPMPIGICFEGIRVSSNTPGYRRETFLVIMNSSNNKFVTTDVVRSAVEDNEGRNELLRIIYSVYKNYIVNQIDNFSKKGRSMSWIASETRFLVNQLVDLQNGGERGLQLEKVDIMDEVFGEINAILFENEGERKLVSANVLQEKEIINMSESNMIDAAERLLKEAKSSISLSGLVNTVTNEQSIKGDCLLCDYEQSNVLHSIALKEKGVETIVVNKLERKIDLCLKKGAEKWTKILFIDGKAYGQYEYIFLPTENERVQGLEGELGVKTKLGVFLDSEHEITKYILEKMQCFDYKKSNIDNYVLRLFVSLVVNKQNVYIPRDRGLDYFAKQFQSKVEQDILGGVLDDTIRDILWKKVDRNELISLLMGKKIAIYDLDDWLRRDRNT